MKTSKIKYDEMTTIILLALCSYAFAYYMQFEFILWKAAIICIVLYIAKKKSLEYSLNRTQFWVSCLLSCLITISLIIGFHIHVENHYTGLIDTSYITKYHFSDWICAFLIIYGFFIIFKFLFSIHQNTGDTILKADPYRIIDQKRVVIYLSILFLLWLPYLFTYFPGYVFGDSLNSINQALGTSPLDNAHPVPYTLLIRFCFWLGKLGNGITTGCAVYCILQMLYMAYGMGYLFHWLEATFRLKKTVTYVLIGCFGLSPYIAQYSIAMWKDPIFSITILLLTIHIADLLLYFDSPAKKKNGKGYHTALDGMRLFLLLLLMMFSRNNGFYISIALVCFSCLALILVKKRRPYRILLIVCLLAILFSKMITGPVYQQIGISQNNEKVESYGIFLQQMARVVAVNGRLSESDKKYMASLLPLDQYAEVYIPCCVDPLKWNENFHKEAMETGFFQTYFSILRKNPKICFEAWIMQTYGFWTLNCPKINQFDGNILYGVPRNVNPAYTDAADIGIHFKTVEEGAWNTRTFPYQSRCVPIGYLHWLLILLFSLSVLKKDWNNIMILGASLGLMATLFLASPINYWPRYGLAVQLLLPLYLFMLFRLLGNKKIAKLLQQ